MRKISTILSVLIATTLSGCGSDSDSGDANEPEIKFIAEEKVCIDYEVTGVQSGSKTRCYRNWGNEQLEVNDVTMSIGPMSQQTKERIITRGAEIIRVDELTGKATRTTNPMYANMVQAMQQNGGDAQDFGSQMFQAMGGTETDETRTVAGEECQIWSLPGLGSNSCVTEDGLTLASEVNMGIAMNETAVSIRRGDGGDDASWSTEGLQIQEVPQFNGLQDFMPSMPQQ